MRGRPWIPVGLALLFSAWGAARADAEGVMPKTHGAMLDSVARMVAADLLRGAEIPPARAVRIVTPLPGDTLGFLAQRLLERLREGGTEVRLVSSRAAADLELGLEDPPIRAHADSTDLQLNLQVGSAGVSYVRAIRKFPFGVRGYERLASMRVGASLVDLSTREVLWAKSASAQAIDEVRKSDLSYAQSGSGGLSPAPPRAGGGTRLLEPLIVVGVVTGLVVLFYSNRN
ncbi:MAG: hypothetical protein E6K76_08490 [Candidatus Eisenbacteria bacterium]|uniref:TPM domain-containing protein n=1 Tax=Eiseniibacteriota bacterium TaxID=2212470 RepID=A0A538T3J2_UNCEI|nr:MAG: hypothetical protein E6K76_08490 [Candidatus Eisenbacteria bacterium]